MRPTYAGRLADRARRALGMTELIERVAALEGRVAALPAPEPSYPRGPVYFGEQTALVATRWGAKMLVDTRDAAIAPWLALDGMWEPHVTAWLQSTLRRGDVFVDVGANVGYFTLLGAQLVGREGLVVAVEAHSRLFGILQRNVVINGVYGYVTTHHRAAWSEDKELEFHVRANFAGNSSVGTIDQLGLDRLGDTEETVRVKGVRMDELLAGLPRVDVMKIDVEGAEVHVFEGLRATIEANPHMIVMFEWATAQIESVGDRPAALAEMVEGFGYKLKLLETGEPIDTGQLLALPYGNVVAAR